MGRIPAASFIMSTIDAIIVFVTSGILAYIFGDVMHNLTHRSTRRNIGRR